MEQCLAARAERLRLLMAILRAGRRRAAHAGRARGAVGVAFPRRRRGGWRVGWRWGAGLRLAGGTAREQAERSRRLVGWVAEPGQHIVSLRWLLAGACMLACIMAENFERLIAALHPVLSAVLDWQRNPNSTLSILWTSHAHVFCTLTNFIIMIITIKAG